MWQRADFYFFPWTRIKAVSASDSAGNGPDASHIGVQLTLNMRNFCILKAQGCVGL